MTLELTTRQLSDPGPDRPVLVLGPSLGTGVVALWGRCAALLADRYRIVGWELPGHAGGTPTRDPYTVEELATAVVRAVDSPTGARTFQYAGDSIGGAVGLALLLDHADRIEAATVVCSGARIGDEQTWTQRAEQARTEGTDSLVEGAIDRWFAPGFVDREPDAALRLVDTLRGVDDGCYALACDALRSFDVRHRLGEITDPLTVIAGSHDVAAPVANAQLIADHVRHAELLVLDHVAHLAPIEDPQAVADAIVTLSAVRARPSA